MNRVSRVMEIRVTTQISSCIQERVTLKVSREPNSSRLPEISGGMAISRDPWESTT